VIAYFPHLCTGVYTGYSPFRGIFSKLTCKRVLYNPNYWCA